MEGARLVLADRERTPSWDPWYRCRSSYKKRMTFQSLSLVSLARSRRNIQEHSEAAAGHAKARTSRRRNSVLMGYVRLKPQRWAALMKRSKLACRKILACQCDGVPRHQYRALYVQDHLEHPSQTHGLAPSSRHIPWPQVRHPCRGG